MVVEGDPLLLSSMQSRVAAYNTTEPCFFSRELIYADFFTLAHAEFGVLEFMMTAD
jgi:hypothetical protein